MNIQIFIFTWNNYIDNALLLENSLKRFGKTCVINSNINKKVDSWINVNDYYFAGQWNTLLENLDKNSDYIFHVQSDVEIFDCKMLFDRFLEKEKKFNIGVYAPNLNFTYHNYCIDKLKKFDSNVYEVPNTDCTCWFVCSKLLFDKIPMFDLSINNIGYGVDWYYIAKSIILGMDVMRDYEFTIKHPNSTNYNQDIARLQFSSWLETIDLNTKNKIMELIKKRADVLIN